MTTACVITDMQHDFIRGSLAVPDADNRLLTAVLAEAADADIILASQDWHTPDHCSFQAQGGPWKTHCVAGYLGATLDPHVAAFLLGTEKPTYLVRKGYLRLKDSYSVWGGRIEARWNTERFHGAAGVPINILEWSEVDHVKVVGVAYDVCVKATALDAIASGYETSVPQAATRAVNATGRDIADVELVSAGVLLT